VRVRHGCLVRRKVANDLHSRHRSSQLDSLLPPLQEQVTLLPLAVHVAVCSESLQNSLQSLSSSLSQAEEGDENPKAVRSLATVRLVREGEIELARHTFGLDIDPGQDSHLARSWSCCRVSDCSQPSSRQVLPLRSRVMADERATSSGRVTAILKSILVAEFVCLCWCWCCSLLVFVCRACHAL
jgi:hypothetical protein